MRLVNHQANNIFDVEGLVLNVFLERLRGAKEHSASAVELLALLRVRVAVHLRSVTGGEPHNVQTGGYLLVNQGLCRGCEQNQTLREEAVVVVHDNGRDQSLPEAGGERHQGVFVDGALYHFSLIVPDGKIFGSGVNEKFCCFQVEVDGAGDVLVRIGALERVERGWVGIGGDLVLFWVLVLVLGFVVVVVVVVVVVIIDVGRVGKILVCQTWGLCVVRVNRLVRSRCLRGVLVKRDLLLWGE